MIIATSRSIATLDRHTLRKTRSGLLCVRQSSISTGLIDNISGLLWHGKSSWCRHCFGLQIEGETRVDTPHTLTIQRWDLVPFYFDEHPLFQETRKGTTCSAFELLRINRSFVVRIGRLEAFLDDREKLVFV